MGSKSDLIAEVEALKVELKHAERERDRLLRWLEKIDGGDQPCQDELQLRQWAFEAVTLGMEADHDQ
jgi:hypothetical protein